MNPNDQNFYSSLYQKTLWWCFDLNDENTDVTLSPSLEKLLNNQVHTIDELLEFMLPESSHLFWSKVESLVDKTPQRDRFIMGLQIGDEIKWLINELNKVTRDGFDIICVNCIDVTEMYELEEKLVETNSRLIIEQLQAKEAQSKRENELLQKQYTEQTRFLAMLSHELRSPLVGVGSLINMMKTELMEGKSVFDQLKVMKLTIDQMNFLINDILTYSQTQSEYISLNPAVFSIEEMADYVSHLTKSIANEKGVFVNVSLDCQHACFFGDVVRISQILINLIVNAIKFTQQGGVFVELSEHSSGLILTITDSGEGIAPDQISNIFEPFRQLESQGSGQHMGSGLGLPVVKTLVDLLGGQIQVDSILGEGTTFNVSIPVEVRPCPQDKSQAEPDEEKTRRASIANQKRKLKVLIADDSIINRKVLEVFLQEVGCLVDQAADGDQAWQMFREKDYDFVFLDIQMPNMTGAEVCQKIRELEESVIPNLKGVFALTAAHTEDELGQMGIKIDKSMFDEWIEKPISEDKVIKALYSELKEREHVAQKPLAQKVPESLMHLIPQFVESTKKSLEQVDKELNDSDGQTFKKSIHTLKGNLMMFHLDEMVELAKKIEQKDFTKEKSEIADLLDQLNQIFRRLY